MALSKIVCPECAKVLRPARPVEEGQKVRCPSCELIFVAGEEEEDERPARSRKPARAAAGKPKAKPPAKKKKDPVRGDDEEEEGSYGVARDDEDEDKPKVDYAPDMGIKDLRGPAQTAIMSPSNKLVFAGFLGVAGAVILFTLMTIPALMPVREEPPKDEAAAKKKAAAKKTLWYEVYGLPLPYLTSLPWDPDQKTEVSYGGMAIFCFGILLPIVLLGLYSCLVAMGGIKAQNLESRGWGIAGSIMAMFPLNTFCASIVVAIAIRTAFTLVLDEDPFIAYVYIGLGVIMYLFSLASGIWTLITLNDEDVIEGFEYKGEG